MEHIAQSIGPPIPQGGLKRSCEKSRLLALSRLISPLEFTSTSTHQLITSSAKYQTKGLEAIANDAE
jgi:hypothetical protein